MNNSVQYYRPPRRVPTTRTEESTPRNRARDLAFLFGTLIVACIILYVGSIVLREMGFHTLSLGIQLFAIILIWVTIGVGATVGITYYVMRSFLKHEFNKKFEKMEQQRYARYRQMMGLDESNDKPD